MTTTDTNPLDGTIGATPKAEDARTDWENRIYTRLTDTAEADPGSELPAPTNVSATAAVGHVLLGWDEVSGAAGYVIERRDGDGDPHLVGHGGADVPAVPGLAFADTGLTDGVGYRYRVGAVAGAEYPAWHWSEPVTATTAGGSGADVRVAVDAASVTGTLDRVWTMVGSERLTQLRFGDVQRNGHDIGTEFEAALRQAHEDLGVTFVRAHAILDDDNHVVTRADDGTLRFDFTGVDELYDRIIAVGVRPIVELGFMPSTLASDPEATVFTYRGIISPPKDWTEWHDVVAALAAHLVERYGIDEVASWGFEVWNEPNLVVFWTGTQEQYLRLYTEAARAVKSVDARLRVGGPSTAASEWVETLAAHAEEHGLPLDFVTSHTYGNMPLDTRPALARHGFEGTPIWWTEWGAGSTHFGAIHDSVIGAPFVLSGYKSVQGRMQVLAYWVVSDHFEELGRPPRLFHDGFGLLTVGNLRKPRYWATHLAAHLGDTVLASSVTGDGADVLVQSWATRHDDGTVDVLLWNGTINGALLDGDARLDRHVVVDLDGLPRGPLQVQIARVDATHSNIVRHAPAGVDWPDEDQFAALRAHDVLDTEDREDAPATDGRAEIGLDLPMPGVARIRLVPRSTQS